MTKIEGQISIYRNNDISIWTIDIGSFFSSIFFKIFSMFVVLPVWKMSLHSFGKPCLTHTSHELSSCLVSNLVYSLWMPWNWVRVSWPPIRRRDFVRFPTKTVSDFRTMSVKYPINSRYSVFGKYRENKNDILSVCRYFELVEKNYFVGRF